MIVAPSFREIDTYHTGIVRCSYSLIRKKMLGARAADAVRD